MPASGRRLGRVVAAAIVGSSLEGCFPFSKASKKRHKSPRNGACVPLKAIGVTTHAATPSSDLGKRVEFLSRKAH